MSSIARVAQLTHIQIRCKDFWRKDNIYFVSSHQWVLWSTKSAALSNGMLYVSLKYCDFRNTIIGCVRLRLKCDGTRAEVRFRLSARRTSPFKSARVSVQSTTGSRGVRISGSNAGYNMFRDSVKGTGYPLHSPVSPLLPIPCVAVCHYDSTGL